MKISLAVKPSRVIVTCHPCQIKKKNVLKINHCLAAELYIALIFY